MVDDKSLVMSHIVQVTMETKSELYIYYTDILESIDYEGVLKLLFVEASVLNVLSYNTGSGQL